MSLRALIGVSIVASAVPAFAERSIVVEVVDGAPFDGDELASAMRVRLPAEGALVRVRVSPATDGVRIEARGSVRSVQLGELRGAAAARLVALAANDLLLEDLAIAPPPELAPPSSIRSHATPSRRGSTSIAVLGAAAAWPRAFGGFALDVVAPRDRWLLAVDAGGGQLVDGPLELSAVVVRIGAGVRLGAFEVRAGATLVPVFVGDGIGDRTVLVGAGASARLRVSLADGIGAVVAGGADVFATRTTYVVEGMAALTTPRAAPWLAAGIEVTP